jgi:hypothetical protein
MNIQVHIVNADADVLQRYIDRYNTRGEGSYTIETFVQNLLVGRSVKNLISEQMNIENKDLAKNIEDADEPTKQEIKRLLRGGK